MSWPSFCIACGRRIDLDELQAYKAAGREYAHVYGRVLIPEKTNAPR